MKHLTIDYGIDLGTTNSAICRVEQGEPVMLRSDSGMETMPSCISFKKSGTLSVGYSAFSELGNSKLRALKRKKESVSNSCVEFKRYMGSDKRYTSSYAEHMWTPEELSAQVLKTLCSFATDDEVKAAVITVPAKFTVNQKDATLEAAHLAGIDQVELLQEPIAASMAYGLKSEEKEGIWMVFDLGGGTLDVALVHVSDGVMQVFDTEGDNYLGGKNIDEAIVSQILLPELMTRYAIDVTDTKLLALYADALKVVAEKLKNKLSYVESETITLEAGDWGEDMDGEEIELELTVTREQFEAVARPILQKAVDVCRELMIRNRIEFGRLSHLILIGGPTNIPLLRRMLGEQVTPHIESDIDPMTAVAQGAAVYAATIPVKRAAEKPGDDSLALDIDFESTCVDTETYVTVKCADLPEGLRVGLRRVRDGWESPLMSASGTGVLLIAELLESSPNTFEVVADVDGVPVKCFPSEITIIQGTKVGSAILPYNIGIEVYNPKKEKRVFTALTGLEKNRPLPASGYVYGLHTLENIYAGDMDSKLRIAIYQGDNEAEGKTAALFEHVADIVITGDDVSTFIPKDTETNVRIDVNRSEMMTVTCEFTKLHEKVTKKLDTSTRQEERNAEYLHDLIERANVAVHELAENQDLSRNVAELLKQLERITESLEAGAQHKQVEQHVKEVLRRVEQLGSDSEWLQTQKALHGALYSLQVQAVKYEDDQNIRAMVESYRAQVDRICALRDIAKARFLKHQIEEYEYSISQAQIYRDVINWAYRDFDTLEWTNREEARRLVNHANEILRNDPEAPLSATKAVVEAFYCMIIRDENKNNSDSRNRNSDRDSYIKLDILSM